ncbi:MAG TPA: Bax inhibitor-1/YccA family protein [Gemmatimonadaceae bacterium]|nr:Bax inhibitor-1/YccA family protein [Gemmatimonadaceae bacterium]
MARIERSNPALRSAFERTYAGVVGERMSIEGTVGKTILLLLLTIFSAGVVWVNVATNPALVGTGLLVGVFGGLVVAMVTVFKPNLAPWTAPLYAVLEGLALGAISAVYNARYAGLPLQAVGLTAMTALGMLIAYRTGLIRATPTFRRVIVAATFGVMLFYLLTIVLGLFGVRMPFIYDASPIGILFSLFVTGLAAFNLVLDFDLIEQGARQGAPKYMEWYGGFALIVTLIWLYLEILRLLGKLQRR